MPKEKPVPYPNLLDRINKVTDAHAAIHDDAKAHAEIWYAAIEAKRKRMHVAHVAKKLIESDGKS
jgi:hypothetical protein